MPNIESKTVATRDGQGCGSGRSSLVVTVTPADRAHEVGLIGQQPLSLNEAWEERAISWLAARRDRYSNERHGTSDRLTMPAGTLKLERNSMRTDDHRRSTNFEDRGTGRGGGGGVPLQALTSRAAPRSEGYVDRRSVGRSQCSLCCLRSSSRSYWSVDGAARERLRRRAPAVSAKRRRRTARRVISRASSSLRPKTCGRRSSSSGALPAYGTPPGAYRHPTLVVFARSVSTGGCGNATSDVGPFYCPADEKLYIDPSFYGLMEKRLRAPGDFAQAYVIAHEVGHHVQNLIGVHQADNRAGETSNQSIGARRAPGGLPCGRLGSHGAHVARDHGRGSRGSAHRRARDRRRHPRPFRREEVHARLERAAQAMVPPRLRERRRPPMRYVCRSELSRTLNLRQIRCSCRRPRAW